MNEAVKLVIIGIAAYALGNINPSIIIGKLKGIDIRKEGSGNAGMTNTIRVMGIGAGITVFVIDVLKAFIAVRIGISFGGKYGAMVAFACVILGHCFPAAFGFKGGKGVASAFGAALALNWPSALIAILVAGVLFGITRRMSVASLVAALSYPVLIWHFAPDYLYFSIGAAAFLMLMHMANIKRIAKGEEKAPRRFLAFKGESTLRDYVKSFVIGAVFLAAYLPAGFGFVMPVGVSLIIMALGIVGGIVSLFILRNFKNYRKMYQKGITEFLELQTMAQEQVASLDRNKIDDKTVVTSNKKGFEFLNELFVKRHRKILWRSSRNTAVVLLTLIVIAAVMMLIIPEAKEGMNLVITTQLRFVAFGMYAINKGQNYTRALFSNCDHSLLTYPIYRKGSNILKLFKLRLFEISKVNMLPAGILAAGLALLLFLSGGPEKPIYYLVLIVSVLALGVFFSVHYLVMYYLLQPFNVNTEVKSGTYPIIMGATYLVCYMMIQIEVPSMAFGIFTAVFGIIYSIVACVLAYYLAPKTFKLRT